jgi:hypothetical protein
MTSPTASNSFLNRNKTRVFAYTAADQSPMAGRQREEDELLAALSDPERRVYRLWAPLGSGKTFLLNNVIGELARNAEGALRDEDVVLLSVPALAEAWDEPLSIRPRQGRVRTVMIIEEFDRKTSFSTLMRVATRSRAWIEETTDPDPFLVLTGDAFMHHPALTELFGADADQVATLDPLDEEFLVKALALRLDRVRQIEATQPSDQSLVDARMIVAVPEIRTGLIPPTHPGVATFRDALSMLYTWADRFPPNTTAIDLPQSLLSSARSNQPSPGTLAAELLDSLVTYVRELAVVEAMDEYRLVELVDIRRGEPDDYDDVEGYKQEAVEPLVKGGFLLPQGTPYFDGDAVVRGGEDGIRGPYLPGPWTYRLALA